MGSGCAHGNDGMVDHRGKLAAVLTITVTVLVVEVVGTVISGSLALLVDAAHMLTDVDGLTLAFIAAVLARQPATDAKTRGYRRAEVLAAAGQAPVLLAVGGFVLVEAAKRTLRAEVTSGVMFVFGVVGLIGNIIGIAILASRPQLEPEHASGVPGGRQRRPRAVRRDRGRGPHRHCGWMRADTIASLVIGVLIHRTLRLLGESLNVLLESTPPGLDLSEVRARMMRQPHARHVHGLHASQVATGLSVLTAPVVVDDSCFLDGHLGPMLDELRGRRDTDLDLERSTIPFAAATHLGHEHETHA